MTSGLVCGQIHGGAKKKQKNIQDNDEKTRLITVPKEERITIR